MVSGSSYSAPYIDNTRASLGMVRYVGGQWPMHWQHANGQKKLCVSQ
jgi:hypothetical protein